MTVASIRSKAQAVQPRLRFGLLNEPCDVRVISSETGLAQIVGAGDSPGSRFALAGMARVSLRAAGWTVDDDGTIRGVP